MKTQQRKASLTITVGPETAKQLEHYLDGYVERNQIRPSATSVASAALVLFLRDDAERQKRAFPKDLEISSQ